MTTPNLTLISHHLCPFVQRVAIALVERQVTFERRNIDLANKPDWFLKISPLGKVPVLVVDRDTVLFESSVIAQFVDEISGGRLLSSNPLDKARQRAWMEYASQVLAGIARLYNANGMSAFESARADLENRFARVEDALGDGPWFAGDRFTLVDAAFAPAWRYFDVIEELVEADLFDNTPKLARWRQRLSNRPSVIDAVSEDYPHRLLTFLSKRDSVIGRLAHANIEARLDAA